MKPYAWLASLLLVGITSMPFAVAHTETGPPPDVSFPSDDVGGSNMDAPEEDAGSDDDAAEDMDAPIGDDTGASGMDAGPGHDSGPIVPVPLSDGCSCRASSPAAPSGLLIGSLAVGLALAARRR